jgi:hypothetical protein
MTQPAAPAILAR